MWIVEVTKMNLSWVIDVKIRNIMFVGVNYLIVFRQFYNLTSNIVVVALLKFCV